MIAELLFCIGIAHAASWVGISYSLAWQLEVADAEEVVDVVVPDMAMVCGLNERNEILLLRISWTRWSATFNRLAAGYQLIYPRLGPHFEMPYNIHTSTIIRQAFLKQIKNQISRLSDRSPQVSILFFDVLCFLSFVSLDLDTTGFALCRLWVSYEDEI